MAFVNAGFRVEWANDSDSAACATYRANHPGVRILECPIEQLSVARDRLQPVDVLTAGFPCQPFSVAGDKLGFEDPRGMAFFEISRLLGEYGSQRPKIVLLENVAHILNHDSGRTFARIVDALQDAGYWFSEKNARLLNTCEHTDIPQIRQRCFMAAVSTEVSDFNDFRFPDPVSETRAFRGYLDLEERPDEWHYFDVAERWGKLFKEAMDEGDPDAPYQLRRYYVREMKNKLVPTLTANMGDGGHNQPVIKDSWGIRKFTVRECLRLQGFPEDFMFPDEVTRYQRYKQVGNSVTVPLVEKLANECLRQLARSDNAEETA